MKKDPEFHAIKIIMSQLEKLTESGADRVMKYVAAKYHEERMAKLADRITKNPQQGFAISTESETRPV